MADGSNVAQGWAEANGTSEPPEKGFWRWVWEAIQGDFNQDRTIGQLSTDMVISLIPIVDTICDIRDLCANLRALRKDPKNKMLYFFLVLTVIGFFPELGTIAKGSIKIVFAYLRRFVKHFDELLEVGKLTRLTRQAVDAALPKITEFLSHSRVVKWATKNGVPDVYRFVAKEITKLSGLVSPGSVRRMFDKGVSAVERLLNKVRYFVPSATRGKMDEFLTFLSRNKSIIRGKLDEFSRPVRTVLDTIAKRLDDHAWVALTQTRNKGWIAPITQEGAASLMRKHPPRWVSASQKMAHQGYSPTEASALEKIIKKKALLAEKRGQPYPKAIGESEISTFKKGTISPATINGPAKLYRIVDPTNTGGGKFWVDEKTFKSLKNRDEWRSKLAVKPEWNQNGSYVVYDLKDGESLQVWRGTAGSQKLDGTNYHLEGGAEQIVFEPKPDTMQFGNKPRIDAKTGERAKSSVDPTKTDNRIEFKDVTGRTAPTAIRGKINDQHITGPFDTGWGFADWNGEQARDILVAVPPDIQ